MAVTTVAMGVWNNFATKITAFLPNLIVAIILFAVGWTIARLLKVIIVKVLEKLYVDSATEKTGVQAFLNKGGFVMTPSEITGALVYWFVMVLVIVATFDALELPVVSDFLNSIFLYIPQVAVAIIILILGFLFGNFLSAVVRTAASSAGLKAAGTLENITLYSIVLFAVTAALVQLGIAPEIVTSAFVIGFGAIALALALAFGLGGKELAAAYLKKWLDKVS
ncbi:MAG: hypothetical protein PHY29_07835 [Syntrophales bacterium]|nr:hypothetical protein [Syntrophales bacterium]